MAIGPDIGWKNTSVTWVGLSSGYTYLEGYNPSTVQGIIRFCNIAVGAHVGDSNSIKIKSFYPDSTYYRFIGESPLIPLLGGLCNNVNINVPVEVGSIIGIYIALGYGNKQIANKILPPAYKIEGDITYDTLKSAWTIVISDLPNYYSHLIVTGTPFTRPGIL